MIVEEKCLPRTQGFLHQNSFFQLRKSVLLHLHNMHNEGSNISDENGIYFFFHLHLWVHLRRNLSQPHTHLGTQIHAKAIKKIFTTDERENDSNKFLVWFFWSIKQSAAVGLLVSLWREPEKKLQAISLLLWVPFFISLFSQLFVAFRNYKDPILFFAF